MKHAVIGYKKAHGSNGKEVIVKLGIPQDTMVFFSAEDGGKSRASQAEVLSITSIKGTSLPRGTFATSGENSNFHYRVGDVVSPDEPFDVNYVACSTGIHFFLTRRLAERWPL